jgi:hypothetical protein
MVDPYSNTSSPTTSSTSAMGYSSLSFDRERGPSRLPISPSLPLSAFGFGNLEMGGRGDGVASGEAEDTGLPPIPRSLSMGLAGETGLGESKRQSLIRQEEADARGS